MPYIGKAPLDRILGLSEKNTFTGDGSAVNFDMTSAAPEGGDTAVDVFVDNVRQEPGTGKAYVLASDGTDFKRITFSAAPPNGAEIWTNNRLRTQVTNILPAAGSITASHLAANSVDSSELVNGSIDLAHMSVNSIDSDQYVDGSIDTAHIATSQVTTALIANDAITGAKIALFDDSLAATTTHFLIADGTDYSSFALSGDVTCTNAGAVTIANTAVQQAMVHTDVFTGQSAITEVADADVILVYDDSASAYKKVTKANFGGGIKYVEKTSAFTAVKGEGYLINTGSAVTATLPASPAIGAECRFIDATGGAASNNITIARNSEKIQGASANLTIATARAAIGLVYYNTTHGWVLTEN
jgi:hypothetical protein